MLQAAEAFDQLQKDFPSRSTVCGTNGISNPLVYENQPQIPELDDRIEKCSQGHTGYRNCPADVFEGQGCPSNAFRIDEIR